MLIKDSAIYALFLIAAVVMETLSPGFQIFGRRPSVKRLSSYVPADSVFYVTYGFTNGTETWKALREHMHMSLALGSGMPVEGRLEFEKELGFAEEARGFGFDEIAGVIDNEMAVFMWYPDEKRDSRYTTLLAFVKDVRRAHRLAEQYCGDIPIERRERGGVTVHVARRGRWTHLAWAFIDDVMLISYFVEPIEAAVDAHRRGRTLADSAAYRAVDHMLPPVNIASGFWNLDRAFITDYRSQRERPSALRQFVGTRAIGFTLTGGDGILTARMATAEPLDYASFISGGIVDIRDQTRRLFADALRGMAGMQDSDMKDGIDPDDGIILPFQQ